MLISLVVENFRSFGDEQELSAVANGKHQNLTEHLVQVPGHDEKLVPVIALYGANGAGKSTVVHAISWLMRQLIRPTEYVGRRAHVFLSKERPTRLVLRFLSGENVYELGATLADEGYSTEWLSLVRANGQERPVYERSTDADGRTIVSFGRAIDAPSERLRALALVAARPGELFLARVMRDLTFDELPGTLREPLQWLSTLVVVYADAPYVTLGSRILEDAKFGDLVSNLLRSTGTGVHSIASEVDGRFPAAELTEAERDAFDRFPTGGEFARRGTQGLVKLDGAFFGRLAVRAKHVASDGRVATLPFEAESDGTIRLAHLAPALYEAPRSPCVFVIDELDRSLHATLVKEFLREYLTRARGTRSQLIFTTHETHVLDQELLRRDEVWFVEKNKDGASELFSLDDFPVRTDLRLDRSYLQGRFGAVPNIESP